MTKRIVLAGVAVFFCFFMAGCAALLNQWDDAAKPEGTLANSLAPEGKAALPTHFLQRPHGKIAYDDTQTAGPLVICVPGVGDLRQEYRFLAPQLMAAGYRVVTMDLRGMGQSSVNWPNYSSRATGSDIVALIQHLHAGPAYVIGDSMAGAAAIWAASSRPSLVKGLVLMDAFVRPQPTSLIDTALLKFGFAGRWGIPMWSLFYKSEYPTSPPTDLSRYRGVLKANLRQPGRFAALKKMLFSGADPTAVLNQVKAPVLVVYGTKDADFKDPSAEGAWLAGQLHGKLVMIPGAGHYPAAEMPGRVGPKIITFLSAPRQPKAISRFSIKSKR